MRRVFLETFGCQMNELDSELVAGQLRTLGYRFTQDARAADVVLYNTCSVREHAEQKVWSRLGEMAVRKAADPSLVVGVMGCMAERDGEDLIRRMPVVDILVGPGELDKLPALLDNAVKTRESLCADDPAPELKAAAEAAGFHRNRIPGGQPAHAISAGQVALQGNTSRRTATLAAAADSLELLDLSRSISPLDDAEATDSGVRPRSAYVRITRGCNKFCTYCVVPFTRGAEVHRPPEHIIDECRKLADAGVVEITLLGQTVNHYRFEHGAAVTVGGLLQPQKGRAYQGGHRRDPFKSENTTTFADLLSMIHERVPGIQRLRFVTSYPRDFGDDVLEVIRDHPRICRYLHVPAQSGSDRLLQMMNRGYTVAEYLEFLDRTRAFLDQPEIGRPLMVSGDFIVGFPSETDEDFEATMALCERARYKNSFIFKYSPRPGTIAFDKLTDDVPEPVKRRRNNALLALQNRISDEISREQVGRTYEVLVEGFSSRERKKQARARVGVVGAGMIGLTVQGRALGSDLEVDEADTAAGQTPEAGEGPVQLACRTDTDQIVLVEAPNRSQAEALVGRILRVHIDSAVSLALHASLVP